MDGYLDHELRERRVAAKRRIVVAHHEDDQAETVLMRLARGSGLDGMSGMREEERVSTSPSVESSGGSYTIVRPLLRTPKARLIATLEAAGRSWRDDPSNLAPEFERVRVRQALETLGQLGIGPAQIGRSAWRLSRARRAVLAGVDAVATRAVKLAWRAFCRDRSRVPGRAARGVRRAYPRRSPAGVRRRRSAGTVVADRAAGRAE